MKKNMKNQLNEAMISSIRSHISEGDVLVNVLMDILCIGKEAAYRRIRGDVLFTFDEVAKISHELGISLDTIVDTNNKSKSFLFNLNLYPTTEYILDVYCKMMNDHLKVFYKMKKDSDSLAKISFNTLPYYFYNSFQNISKFRLFRWMYQTMGINAPNNLSSFSLTSEILDLQKKYVIESSLVTESHIILDKNSFLSLITDINYFYKLNLISDSDLKKLKEELLELLAGWELMAMTGKTESGKNILIYISNVNFESCYSYYKSKSLEISHIRVYSINGLSSTNPYVCKIHNEWIESLKRYSTLITQSGEIQRIEFFRKQRGFINKLL
ncbi:hypothetical protein C4S76_05705 [Apibacter adventoris]|nr:hypothetical protein C4S76_05705 [Apibacter adventoris]